MTSALSERQSRRVQETKLRIVNAMRDYLATSTSPAITVEELCERADVARKTFYNHYTSVNQLQMELLAEFVTIEYQSREYANAVPGNYAERYGHYVAYALARQQFELDNYWRNILQVGIEAYYQQSEESAKMLCSIRQSFLYDWLQAEMDREQWMLPFSPQVFFELYFSMQTNNTVHTVFQRDYPFRDDLFDVQDLMFRYLARKKLERFS